MKRILFSFIAILTLQPILAMDSDDDGLPAKARKSDGWEPSQGKRARIDSSNEESSNQDELANLQSASERARDTVPYPRPPEVPLAPALVQLQQEQIWLQRAEERRMKEESRNFYLRSAAANGNCELIAQLLREGADLHEKNNFTRLSACYFSPHVNAFDLAVHFNQERACRLLVAHGAQPTDVHLYDAAERGHVEICKFLIEYGINVNARYGAELNTPLMDAVDCGQYHVCELLLAHGADIDAQDEDGKCALFVAVENNFTPICQLLIKHGANVHASVDGCSVLRNAAVNGYAQICKLLLMHGANPNDQSASNMPILIDCVLNATDVEPSYDCIKVLLEYGADINILKTGMPINYKKNAQNMGSTVLMHAAYHGELPLCELLLQWGADSEFQNTHGGTALSYAIQGRIDFGPNDESLSVITLLRDPARIRAVIMRADNPRLQRRFGIYSNICHALQKRELGKK